MDPRAATNKLRVPFFKLARGITRAALAYPAIMIGFYTHTQNRDSDTLRLAYPLAENRDGLKIKSSMDETYKIGPQYNNMGYDFPLLRLRRSIEGFPCLHWQNWSVPVAD